MVKAAVVSIDSAEHYRWGEQCDGWHLAKSAGLSVIQESVPAGARETRHRHEQAEQFFYVLSGTATIEVDGVRHLLGPQQGLSVKPAQAHCLSNETDQTITFLVVSTPPSHGDRQPA